MNKETLTAFIRKHPVGVVGAAVSLILGVVFYLRMPVMENLQQQVDDLTRQNEQMTRNLTFAVGLEEEVEQMKAALEELEGRLIQAGELARNLQYFYKVEADTEVKIVTLRQEAIPAQAGPATAYRGVPFTVAVTGPHARVLQFLATIEQGPQVYRLRSFRLTPDPEGGVGRSALNFEFQFLGRP